MMMDPQNRLATPGISFPAGSRLRRVFIPTMILMALIAGVSAAGILFPDEMYRTESLKIHMLPNDLLNLAVGLPLILISLILTRGKKLLGLLFYPGALFYITYIYTVYLLGLPVNVLFLPYLVLVVLSIYTLVILVSGINREEVREMLGGQVPIRASGVILGILTCLMVVYQGVQIVMALTKQLVIERMMAAQWIDDLVIAAPFFIWAAWHMIQRRALGYVLGAGLLLVLWVLFIGLIPIIIAEGILTGTTPSLTDILVVAVSSMICLIPLILFVKGILRTKKETK